MKSWALEASARGKTWSTTGPTRVPTVFVWGNRDQFVSRAAAELCGRYVKGPYRFVELDGASHWLPERAPDRVAALLTEHFTTAAA